MPKLNYWYYIAILETISLYANYWIVLNRIISAKWQYLKQVDSGQTNDEYQKEMIRVRLQYVKPFNCVESIAIRVNELVLTHFKMK